MGRRSRNWLKISELAELAGVMPSTVRYYTDIGLLDFAGETPGGHRLYEKDFAVALPNHRIHQNDKRRIALGENIGGPFPPGDIHLSLNRRSV